MVRRFEKLRQSVSLYLQRLLKLPPLMPYSVRGRCWWCLYSILGRNGGAIPSRKGWICFINGPRHETQARSSTPPPPSPDSVCCTSLVTIPGGKMAFTARHTLENHKALKMESGGGRVNRCVPLTALPRTSRLGLVGWFITDAQHFTAVLVLHAYIHSFYLRRGRTVCEKLYTLHQIRRFIAFRGVQQDHICLLLALCSISRIES